MGVPLFACSDPNEGRGLGGTRPVKCGQSRGCLMWCALEASSRGGYVALQRSAQSGVFGGNERGEFAFGAERGHRGPRTACSLVARSEIRKTPWRIYGLPPPSGKNNVPLAAERRGAALAALYDLHAEIDREAERLTAIHAERLVCGRGCAACCLDGLSVAPVEAERIRRAHPALLREGVPGPEGGCAFLDERGACRVYADRPSVCRSQGLPLRVLYEDDEEAIQERRDICPLNREGGPALEALAEDVCWLIGPFELRLAAIDASFAGEEASRVPLRSLFERDGAVHTR